VRRPPYEGGFIDDCGEGYFSASAVCGKALTARGRVATVRGNATSLLASLQPLIPLA